MMNSPLISVIIPVHNAEDYIDKCLNSVVNQTYANLEIIMVENNSTDESYALCQKWAKKDNRIVLFQVKTKGAAAARNYALDAAKGDYVLFVDSDDWCELDMVETLYSNLYRFEADIAVCGYQFNDDEVGDNDAITVNVNSSLKQLCRGDNYYGIMCNKLYKKAVIGNVRMLDFACSEDLVFNYFVFKKAKEIVVSNVKLYHYYQNAASTVHGTFGIGAFDAVHSREIMLSDVKGTEFEQDAVYGLIVSCFVVLSGVIRFNTCMDKYDYLRNYIKKYRSFVLHSKDFSLRDKLRTVVLCFSKRLYNFLLLH